MVQKHNAIIIDDDSAIAGLLGEILEINELEVVGYGINGKQAIDLFQELRPDIVFLDYHMPQFDGIYALDAIRKLSKHAKIIMITADDTLQFNPRVMGLKPDGVIIKPFTVDVVSQHVQRIISQFPILDADRV